MNQPVVTAASAGPNRSLREWKKWPATPTSIGVVGLGRMGAAFASNLLDDGHDLVLFDRDPARAADLGLLDAVQAEQLSELSACRLVITALPDDAALSAVTLGRGGLADSLGCGAVHISMSTISPDLSRQIEAEHDRRGQGYVAAPVLGNPDLARARKLYVIAAGGADAMADARPLLERLGQHVFLLGEDAATANLMKLAGNVLTAATLQSMGEVLALLEKGGIDPRAAFAVFTGSLFDGKVHKAYGGKIVEGRYNPPGMTVPLAVKDLRLALGEAERLCVPMPTASVVHDRLVAATARGWSGLDWSVLGRLAASEAGLPTPRTEEFC